MSRNVELRQKRWSLVEQAEAILEKASGEARAMTPTESHEVGRLLVEAEHLMAEIRRVEAEMDRERSLPAAAPYARA